MQKEKSIGSIIKSIREEKELSQTEVVQMLSHMNLNMSRETLSKIETDNRSISAYELNAICKALDTDISSFFDEEETEDLVTLFRKKGTFSDDTLKEIEELQDMVKVFISQKEIYMGEHKATEFRPLWEDC